MKLLRVDRAEDAPRIREQMPGYLAELNTFLPTSTGSLVYPYLEHYWREPDRHAFLISDQNEDCGFALVRRLHSGDANPDEHSIAEFYVQPAFRRTGVGKSAVRDLLKIYPGPWLIQVLEANLAARMFWQRTLSQVVAKDMGPPQLDQGFYNFRFTI